MGYVTIYLPTIKFGIPPQNIVRFNKRSINFAQYLPNVIFANDEYGQRSLIISHLLQSISNKINKHLPNNVAV